MPFLDTLRAVAALSVLLAHTVRQISPSFEAFTFTWFDPGTCGVTIFFLCSGFIIPAALERHQSLAYFWTQRFFRLFPLYWLSMAGVLLCAALAYTPGHLLPPDSPAAILANATMLPSLLGASPMMWVYWTLTFELVFYVIVSLLWMAKVRVGATVAVVAIGVALAMEVLAPLIRGRAVPVGYVGVFVMMFTGSALFQRWRGGLKRWLVALIAGGGLGVLITSAVVNGILRGYGPTSYDFQVSAWLVGYAVFGAAYLLRRRRVTALAPLVYLGAISYSLYLLHPFALALIPSTQSAALSVLLWLGAAIGGASLTYRWIEVPMIQLGRRLSQLLPPRAAQSEAPKLQP